MEEKLFLELTGYTNFQVINQSVDGVFLVAEDVENNKVFIKIYYPDLIWQDDQMLAFLDQINVFKHLENEHILPIVDFGKTRAFPFVAYQYKPIRLYRDLISLPIQFEIASNYLKQIALTIKFLHQQDTIHGNLSPDNIYIDQSNHIYMIDYGLHAIFRSVVSNNVLDGMTNLSINLPEYSTPEQLLGRNPTKSSDFYQIGNLFFESLFHQKAFIGETGPSVALAQLENRINWPLVLPRSIPLSAIKFVRRCLFLEPYNRFFTINEIISYLERFEQKKQVRVNLKRKSLKGVPGINFQRRKVYPLSVLILSLLIIVFWFWQPPFVPPEEEVDSTLSVEIAVQIIQQTRLVEITPTPAEGEEIINSISNEPSPAETSVAVPIKITLNQPAIQGESIQFPLEKLTLGNIRQIEEISRLGYGRPEDIDQFGDSVFFVATSSGVYIYDMTSFTKWVDSGSWVTRVKVSTNGKLLAVGLKNGDIQIWDWENNHLLNTFSGHNLEISGLLFSKSDRMLYSISYDRHFIAWDLASGNIIQNLLAHSTPIRDFAMTSDGRTLITVGGDQEVRVWDLATGKKEYGFPFPGKLNAVAVSSDDQFIAAGGELGMIRQWNLKTKQLRTDPIPVKQHIWHLEYSTNDQQLLVTVDNDVKTFSPEKLKYPNESLDFKIAPPSLELIKIFGNDFEFSSKAIEGARIYWNGKLIIENVVIPGYNYDSMEKIVFSKDNNYLAIGGKNQHVYVWDLSENSIVFNIDRMLPNGYVFTPDGKHVIVLENKTYPVSRHRPKLEVKEIYKAYPFAGNLNEITFSERVENGYIEFVKDGTLMISNSLAKSKAWDMNTTYETNFFAYSHNGCLITTSNNDRELLQIMSRAGIFYEFDERINTICPRSNMNLGNFSVLTDDINILFLETNKNTLLALDTKNQKTLWEITLPYKLTALSISHDDALLAYGGTNGKVILLDSKNGNEVNRVTGNYGAVQQLAFSYDGRYIASTGFDGTVRLFGVKSK